MRQKNKILTRARVSLVLLVLISVRLIPYNLLHYHNNQFTSLEVLNIKTGHKSTEEAISNEAPKCSFHQFLSLTNNSFVLDVESQIFEPTGNYIGATLQIESRAKYLPFSIMNKGSPLPV